MASTIDPFETYRTGSGMNYPVVMFSPFVNWESLCVRVKVKTVSELFIGGFCEQADSGTKGIVEKTGDKSLKVFGIIPDTIHNRRQIEIDNSAAATKALFFAANSYIDVLPLIPGIIVSVRIAASNVIDEGVYICSTANGDGRLMAAIATDVDPAARLGRVVSGRVTSGTGTQYIAMAIV